MIGLRPDDQIDIRRTAQDFLSFRLRHAARNADGQFLAIRFARILHLAQTAKRGIELFRRFFTNMAGIEQNQIGIIRRISRDIAFRCKAVGHALAIVDVHLAAIGLYENLARIRALCRGSSSVILSLMRGYLQLLSSFWKVTI